MKMRDAQKYVNRLTLAELKYFAAVGLVFETNLHTPSDAEKVELALRKRAPMMACKFAKTPTSPRTSSASPR